MTDLEIPTELFNRASAGQADAQFALAELYMQSENDDHIELAEEWALKAAQLGYVDAMYWLGEGYAVYAKDICEEDPEESKTYFEYAYHWLKQASELKYPAAYLELASFYRNGHVVEKDIVKSIGLLEQAAKLGEVQAMRDLACIYEYGLGVEIDEKKAELWSVKAQNFS
ncbi:tetratricopeptide repeat protein [Acinetobacter stercoris]|uniref:Putative beta-lactamase HcpC n=1 Tax=Acinetobacter stercoris TaxID=2126983 RepID=A0A2U3MYX9_9GAMM|nr:MULTISPECIES: tetratricopeptide repeat protein [Acinetobacter]SPL70563.1 putative beta-lactamase HcpC precursor [Acinetobacter stercoris]